MAAVKVLARGWKAEIQNPGDSQYVEIKGLNSLTFDSEKNDADITDFDSQGNNEHLVASRGKSLSVEGFYLEDQTTKARDPGQVLVEALADGMGEDSLGNFRLTSPAGTVRYFVASANVTGIGGGNDDPTAWSAELAVSGAMNLSPVAVSGIVVTPATLALTVGQVSSILTTVFTPGNASDKGLTYATSDATKAVVTAEGRVVGVAAGNATITVTAVGGQTDTVAVTVS
jgi:predicted secreted protein